MHDSVQLRSKQLMRNRQEIDSGWKFAFAPYGAVSGPSDTASLDFRGSEVPGTNLTDLQAAGLVDSELSANYENSFKSYSMMDFVYKSTFDARAAADGETVELRFCGLDTVCRIFLNGDLLGETDNAYCEHRFDVTKLLKESDNELLIIFRSPLKAAAERRKKFGRRFHGVNNRSDYMFLRKPAYSFWWDWGPELPVCGIYRPVYLDYCCRARINGYQVRYKINGNSVEGSVEVDVTQSGNAEHLAATLIIDGNQFSSQISDSSVVIPFYVKNAKLWYPNGYGEPYLYDMVMRISDGTVLDEENLKIGFRTIEIDTSLRTDDKGRRMLIRVNGVPVICKGYNWIPIDNSIPRSYEEKCNTLLDLCIGSNVNMLRVWGGGYYEDDYFYQRCDELGLMVWQDGMFSCSAYPDTDKDFMKSVENELIYNIKRLRNHPSLVLWCGENENHWAWETWRLDNLPRFYGSAIYDELFPSLVKRYDQDRQYWNGSPFSGLECIPTNDECHGDCHVWDIHTDLRDFTRYRTTAPSFVSETGIQSLPDMRTAFELMGSESGSIQSYLFDSRNHYGSPEKNDRILKFISALFRASSNLDEATHLSNLAHGEYLRYAVEHWRTLSPDFGGVLLWQLNDCWPCISWSAVDYYMRPKGIYYYMKRAFDPDIVVFKQNYSMMLDPAEECSGDIYVVSDSERKRSGSLDIRAYTVDGEVIDQKHMDFSTSGSMVTSIGKIELPEYMSRRFEGILEIVLNWSDGGSARNIYTYSRPKYMHLHRPNLSVVADEDGSLIIHSDIFAKGVYLASCEGEVVFDDNYFDLLPGESRSIKCSAAIDPEKVRIRSYYHK